MEATETDDVSDVLKQILCGDDGTSLISDGPVAASCVERETEPEEHEEEEEECEVEEIEVVEIIEEIEEVEETEQHENCDPFQNNHREGDITEGSEAWSKDSTTNNGCWKRNANSEDETAMSLEESVKKQSADRVNREKCKTRAKQVVTYNVDQDWEDDDVEMESATRPNCGTSVTSSDANSSSMSEFKSINERGTSNTNKNIANGRNIDKSVKDKALVEYEHVGNTARRVENNGEQHEIVKSGDNNLVYTVLASKKQQTTSKQSHVDKYAEMQRLEESAIPVEGTIYYEGDDGETLYVARSMDDNDRFGYEGVVTEQEEEQDWEERNESDEQQQQQKNQEEEEDEEEDSRDQIFLHEDENGQLYFKNDNGTMQPVYLTADGNYAIAEQSSDDQESQSQSTQDSRMSEQGNFIVPDLDFVNPTATSKQSPAVPALNSQEIDNEDNTVTISLIISEDEHGQKRTQVIIPTSDHLKCELCNKSFKTSFQLLRHNRLKHAREEDITTRNFPCDLCPKRYPDQNSLARHRKMHTGDRPFQCLECHKNFPTSTALRRHLTLHNPQSRPLPCIYCGRRFLDKSSLAKHEQSHLAGDQRTHQCDICQKSFMHASDLNLHKKNHDPEKKFDCEVCGREFNRLNNLQRHMMVHQQQGANQEILACDVCGITYKFMSSLTRHMVTTHMNPEKLRQQAEEQRRKRENNYRRYLENRKMYETSTGYGSKRNSMRHRNDTNDDTI